MTWAHLRTAFAQGLCGARGHAWWPYLEPGRLYLRCVLCHRETPGWEVSTPPLSIRRRLTATSDRRGRIARFSRREQAQ